MYVEPTAKNAALVELRQRNLNCYYRQLVQFKKKIELEAINSLFFFLVFRFKYQYLPNPARLCWQLSHRL